MFMIAHTTYEFIDNFLKLHLARGYLIIEGRGGMLFNLNGDLFGGLKGDLS
jgi:hypothetical protein